MSEIGTISTRDMVSILTADNLLKDHQISTLQKQLDEAMSMIDTLIWAGEHYTNCDCIFCGNVDEARDLMDRRAVAQACALLEGEDGIHKRDGE